VEELRFSSTHTGEWLASTPLVLRLWKRNPAPTGYEAGWDPDVVWTMWRRESNPDIMIIQTIN